MSKQLSDFLGLVVVYAFFGVMGLTPLIVLGLGIVNFVRDSANWVKIALQALGALAIWISLTFILVMVFFMTVFEYPAYRSQADNLKSTAIFGVGIAVYFLIAAVLIYWTIRQRIRRPPMGVSC